VGNNLLTPKGPLEKLNLCDIINAMTEFKNHTPTVLITGASTGIGKACALELDRRGFRVFAGVRSEDAGNRLKEKSSPLLTPIMIDVTDADMIGAAATLVKNQVGQDGLDGLVNNAGICVSGPLELLPIVELRRQLEVNVIGQIAVTQAMIPMLRTAKGRIVNIGSVNGALSPPYLGPYSASKFAMEALTDSLRIELRTWGIKVSIIEPGPIDTPIWEKSTNAADQLADTVPSESMKLYESDIKVLRNTIDKITRRVEPVDVVVKAAVHALTAPNPKTRYFLRFSNRFMFRGFKVCPDVFRDWCVRKAIGLK
jgi:NAD(P)-dependent dehydrogenase (short-subunit alcohol dehydrogenase family)